MASLMPGSSSIANLGHIDQDNDLDFLTPHQPTNFQDALILDDFAIYTSVCSKILLPVSRFCTADRHHFLRETLANLTLCRRSGAGMLRRRFSCSGITARKPQLGRSRTRVSKFIWYILQPIFILIDLHSARAILALWLCTAWEQATTELS